MMVCQTCITCNTSWNGPLGDDCPTCKLKRGRMDLSLFHIGDIVAPDVSGGIRPKAGTQGIISHVGVDNQFDHDAIIVRFENWHSCLYLPDDITIINHPAPFDKTKANMFKLGEIVVAKNPIMPPSGALIREGSYLAVDNQPHPNILHVSHMKSPLFEVNIASVHDYWDTRIRTFYPPTGRSVTHCRLPGCRAENDLGVKSCWSCGNTLPQRTP